MRLLGSLLAVSLSNVNIAIASSFSPAAAAVFYFGPHPQEREWSVPSASYSEFELTLAHRFRLSQFWEVGTADASKITKLSRTGESGSKLFGGNDANRRAEIVISIAGVKDTENFLLNGGLPDFMVEPAPNSATMDNLFADLQMGKRLITKQTGSEISLGEGDLPELYSVPVIESKVTPTADEDWEQFQRHMSSETSSAFDNSKRTHREFVREWYLLHNLYHWELNSEVTKKAAFLMLNLQSLQLLLTDGDLTTYELAVSLFSKFLKDFDTSHTIILLPPSSSSTSSPFRSDELKKRREVPIFITKSSASSESSSSDNNKDEDDKGGNDDDHKGKKVRPAFDGCYSSLSDCEASTDSCSGHGKCNQTSIPYENQGGNKCFKCMCSPEVKEGSATTYWTGSMCQKQDISPQFHILIFITIALIIGIGAAVNLLYSIGGEELPGVLTAGVVSKRN